MAKSYASTAYPSLIYIDESLDERPKHLSMLGNDITGIPRF